MYQTEQVRNYQKEIKTLLAKPVRFGLLLFVIVFFGIGGWATLTKIDKAAVAVGEIGVTGSNKVVQHLEGGIIEKLNVKEGDIVKEGDVLISLSKTAAGSSAQIVEDALSAYLAEYYRLVAKRDNLAQVAYPAEWQTQDNIGKYQQYMTAQNQIFNDRMNAYKGKVGILSERTNQMGSQIAGLRSQIASAKDQMTYVNREIAQVEKLLAQGNTTMSRLLALRSRKSEIDGRLGELTSEISKTEQAISENKLSILNIKNETMNEVAEKIKEAQSKINEFKERGNATTDTLKRTDILAPISGLIKDIKFKTVGGIIRPGEDILTIVPQDSGMIVNVKISPNDIDVVRVGQPARVKLLSYSARKVGDVQGKLEYVSPGVFTDERTQQSFYSGKVSLDMKSLLDQIHNDSNHSKADVNQILYPGMPVQAFISSGSRSPLTYLVQPITTMFDRSLREE